MVIIILSCSCFFVVQPSQMIFRLYLIIKNRLTAKNINPIAKKYGDFAPIERAVEAVIKPSAIRIKGPMQQKEVT